MEKKMPSNIIQINSGNELTWVVGDSEMDNLITFLNKIGDREEFISDASSSPYL
jgi:hypothetical protein